MSVARLQFNSSCWIAFLFLFSLHGALGADLDKARQDFLAGRYRDCIRVARQVSVTDEYNEDWALLLLQSQMRVGEYPEALAATTNALRRYSSSIRLRLAGHDVLLHNGRIAEARDLLAEINQLASTRTWAYRDPANIVALGRAALLLGADPKQVLEKLYDQAKKMDANHREAFLASGELALSKHDYELAAKNFQEGLKKFPQDADFHFGLAQAFETGDRSLMLNSLENAHRFNSNHVASLLLKADHLIDAEEYAGAQKTLDKVFAVNRWEPRAWALRAVLAHLRGDRKSEMEARDAAFKFWAANPEVEHLIGRKLSEKYRFSEGAALQRQALRFDPAFLPAQVQLAQDLLRLGEETEGWQRVEAAHDLDGYNVEIFNLVNLKDSLSKFITLTNADFIVRMGPGEAPVYGARVLDLLERAKTNLCRKYNFPLDHPTIVEIFPDQKDFGVRTFGIPDNPGYLGVCFGSVITANSPASQGGHPANWEAVLWHEFCHVVTLQLTHNKMPRWLSEGISVYEEKQANPAWGQAMNPKYRDMILHDQLAPLGEISAMFLAPKSSLHLQFAYFESSLAVEFLVKDFGLEALKKILADLRGDLDINQAIEKNTAPMKQLEKDFNVFARRRAEELAPGLDWQKPKSARDPGEDDSLIFETVAGPSNTKEAELTSTNYYRLHQEARTLMKEKKWPEAKVPLVKLMDLYPAETGSDSASALLARIHRELGETGPEREVLNHLATGDADAPDVYLRLMELAAAAADWPAVAENAGRFIAVNPLAPPPYRFLAEASEKLGNTTEGIRSCQILLVLDPPDPAAVHFRLAKLLRQGGDPSARRHVLQALEEAPRFRDALDLLLEINGEKPKAKTPPPTALLKP